MNGVETKIEIDPFTKAGHEKFKKTVRFEVEHPDGETATMTWGAWMEWQQTRDPLEEYPDEAEKVRKRLVEEARGPGISRRR